MLDVVPLNRDTELWRADPVGEFKPDQCTEFMSEVGGV